MSQYRVSLIDISAKVCRKCQFKDNLDLRSFNTLSAGLVVITSVARIGKSTRWEDE